MDSQLWTVYIDGSATPNPGRMRIGGIAHAPDGSTHCFSEALAHPGCNNEAEALAAIHALQWLHGQRARQVLLHTDNSILAEQLGRPGCKPVARLADIYARARALLPLFDSVQLRWIPRHRNAVADALARGEELVPDVSPPHATARARPAPDGAAGAVTGAGPGCGRSSR